MAKPVSKIGHVRQGLVGLTLLIMAGVTQGGLFRPTEFEVSATGVVIKSDPYGRSIPMSKLQVRESRVVDLDQEPQMRPGLKINGIGLPNYHSGWHRLRCRETALVFLARSSRAVYIPTSAGHAILIGAERPDEFLAALRQPGTRVHRFRMAGDD
ncbi:MAG: PH domain-containing protein [Isosphaeraceae bacterium]